MMKSKWISLFLLAAGIGCVLPLSAQTDDPALPEPNRKEEKKKSKSDSFRERRFGKIKIRVRQSRPSDYDIRGVLPDAGRVPALAEKFFQGLELLPPSFLEKSRIRYVTFLDDLTLKRVPAGGIAVGDSIYLNTRFEHATVYHEIFHTFDPWQINQNRKWLGFNDKNFVYTGSGFTEMKATKFRRKKRQDNLLTGRFDRDFVSRYAMSNDVEDRAETFAYMLMEGPAFLLRTRESPVLQKKMEFIIDLTGKKKLLGKDFWESHFKGETKRP